MFPSVGQRVAVRESDSPPLQSYQEQPNLTFDSDSGGSASGLSTESTPLSGPIEGCPPIDTFSLSSPQLNLPRVVSSRLLSSVQENQYPVGLKMKYVMTHRLGRMLLSSI